MLNVDVLFYIDVTGSMGSFLSEAKRFLSKSADSFESIGADVKFFVVLYRDHPPQDRSFASRIIANCVGKNKLSTILSGSRDFVADGGGDEPESGLDAIMDTSSLSLRHGSQRFGFIIGDAPLHGTPYSATSTKCKCGNTHLNAIEVVEKFNITMTGVNLSGHGQTTASFSSFCASVTTASSGVDKIVEKMKVYANDIAFAMKTVLPVLKNDPFMPVSKMHKELDIPVNDIRKYIEVLNAVAATEELSTKFEEVLL